VADTLDTIEDWLIFAEPDTAEEAAAVDHGARLVGLFAGLLRDLTGTAPDLYSPDGRAQLAPLIAVQADLRVVVAAVHRAMLALRHEQTPPGAFRALDLLHRCGLCSRSEDAAVLAAAARSGPGVLRLDDRQYRAYQRFARLVLVDPLERFIACPCPSLRPVADDPVPEVEL
jgi:hypothetical protein